ncbi:hypothetical protein ABXS71_08580 [Bacillus infantis]|jgi:hypothetical protein|uniref:hypothetical protein n=1 Tax=Bacillus infantis TaxID=324767 RepID=UPI00344DC932
MNKQIGVIGNADPVQWSEVFNHEETIATEQGKHLLQLIISNIAVSNIKKFFSELEK